MAVLNKSNDPHSPDGKTERRELAAGYLALLVRILAVAAIGVLVFTKVFLVTEVRGNDMYPALCDGDLIIAFRLHRGYAKNDVAVYSCGGERTVGRIAALGHDTVMMDESGIFSVNGTEQLGEILFPTYAEDGLEYPYTVPDGCVFILNDHRTAGNDSREKGAIPLEDVSGKVITLLRRRGI